MYVHYTFAEQENIYRATGRTNPRLSMESHVPRVPVKFPIVDMQQFVYF